MPRIVAPTVAEHRARQRDALLAATRTLLLSEGVDAVTPARLGKATGLARNSVYTYFPSSAAALAELVEDGFSRWTAQVALALEGVEDPERRLECYVIATLRQAETGEHRVAAAMAGVSLPSDCRDRIAQLHGQLEDTVYGIISQLDVRDVGLATTLVQGALDGALRQVDRGESAQEVSRFTVAFLLAGLRGVA